MGMFDTVVVDCPHCGEGVAIQSKAGPCVMMRYRRNFAPAAIAESIGGRTFLCDHCGRTGLIQAPDMGLVRLYTTTLPEDDES